jgi:2-oxoglutarate dehydrogenase E1 component
VNGDDPEAVVYAAKVATEFRMKFHKPVVIDMFCYRRFGHNEGDEPAFTQPIMYRAIRSHQTTVQIYGEKLIAEGHLTQDEFDKMKADWRAHLESEWEVGQSYKPNKADWLDGAWSGLRTADNQDEQRRGKTAMPLKTLKEIGKKLTEVPEGFEAHRTISRFLETRRKMIDSGEGIDWSTAEALAFGSILLDGNPVRLSGQDSERGTFSQRHSVLYDQKDESRYIPLNNLSAAQAKYEVVNSMLSEEAVLGFEYGYSLADPKALTLWEAQFGDFANGAQVVFDQFISSGERKWLRMSGLVCLLPHGYEGQGPEHSNARPERFLQLSAEYNVVVANITEPSNFFHMLRRQLAWNFRKPCIVMSPKSLLRHPKVFSPMEEFTSGKFREIITDPQIDPKKASRVVLCSGKIYYELLELREKEKINDVSIIRIEQLHPLPKNQLMNALKTFSKKTEVVWVQEEPENMGYWAYMVRNLFKDIDMNVIARKPSASPATGYHKVHVEEQKNILEKALKIIS